MGCLLQISRRSSVLLLPLLLVFFSATFLGTSSARDVSFEDSEDEHATDDFTLERIHEYLNKINKPAVLSIESPDGDIIDCVDKWKQPAFDHPLLKNYRADAFDEPVEIPRWRETEEEEEKLKGNNKVGVKDEAIEIRGSDIWQVWHQNGTSCPEGTVPIRRTKVEDVLRAKSLRHFGRKDRQQALARFKKNAGPPRSREVSAFHEYAIAIVREGEAGEMLGAYGSLNVWNPSVERDTEFSLTQLWVTARRAQLSRSWMVYPQLYGDKQTRLFVYWTADGYNSRGCYNHECSGFVQVDRTIAAGAALLTTSQVGGAQYQATFHIWKDVAGAKWWLGFGTNMVKVGYWPLKLFTHLKGTADTVEWGGEIVNEWRHDNYEGIHTSTQMGSGRFAEEGWHNASNCRRLAIVDNGGHFVPAGILDPEVFTDNPNCYNINFTVSENEHWGTHFFYGGPGFNRRCI